MRVVELTIAGLLIVAGLRSLWAWSRRGFEGTDVIDHLLYALFVTGRIALWFVIAGFFLIPAAIDAQGQPALDELARYRWYFIVPLLLAAVQLVAGYILDRRSPDR
jgi:hypothetical protein